MSERRSLTFNYILVVAAIAGYGSFGLFVRWTGLAGQEDYFTFWRVLLALAVIAPICFLARKPSIFRPPAGSRGLLVFNGLAFAGQTYAAAKAINLLPVKDAVFIIYVAPVLVALAAPLVLKEKLERTTPLALAVALGGLALISFAGSGDATGGLTLAGVIWALFSAVCYAAVILSLKALRQKVDTLTVMLYPSVVVVLVFLPFVRFRLPQITAAGWAALVVTAMLHGVLLGIVYVYAVKKIKAQHVGIISYVDPVAATFLAFAFLGEVPLWQDYVGGALIVLAGAIVILSAEREVVEEPWA